MSFATAQAAHTVPLTRETDPDWYLNPSNLADLWRDLEARSEATTDPAYFMDKAWKWRREWERFCIEGPTE